MLLASLIFSREREGMKEKGKDELKERIPQKFRLLRKSNGVGRFIFDGWQDTLCSTYKMPHPGRLKQTWCGREADFPMPKELPAERSCHRLVWDEVENPACDLKSLVCLIPFPL